ncbi:hypothetical protein AB5J72_47885 [Streptomyces sp. CG1]|uniref:hypothetical protein n=1 Tax=Streptomyces sp. CG1 TaxID=1287523 RepID=UPI0034E22209
MVEPQTLRGDASTIKNHVMPYWADWQMLSLMRVAVDDERISVSPCRRIDLSALVVGPPQWFTFDQAQSVLHGLPAVWRTMCLLGFCTGLRWGELTGLHCHRIDRHRSRLFVYLREPART